MRSYGINVVGIVIATIVICLAGSHMNMNQVKKKMFITISILLEIVCSFSILQCVLLYYQPKGSYIALNIMQSISFMIMPIIPLFLSLISFRFSNRKHHYLYIPYLFNVIVLIINMFNGMVCTFDPSFEYIKNSWYIVPVLIAVYSLVLAIVLIFKSLLFDGLKEALFVLAIFISSSLSFILEMVTNQYYLFYNVTAGLILGYFAALSILDMRKDPLANTYNRAYFKHIISEIEGKQDVILLLFDCNGLKEINDTLGHAYGDKMIAAMGNALLTGFGKYGRVFRYGGDEFYVILPSATAPENVIAMIDKYQDTLRKDKVEAAYGMVTYNKEDSMKDALARVDELMYENKKFMKNGNVR